MKRKKEKMDREDRSEKKLKKTLLSHIKEDGKEFRKQLADDVKLKRAVKKKLK